MPTWGIAHAHFKPVISILRTFRLEGTYNWYMNNVDHILTMASTVTSQLGKFRLNFSNLFIYSICLQSNITTI